MQKNLQNLFLLLLTVAADHVCSIINQPISSQYLIQEPTSNKMNEMTRVTKW